MAGGGTFAVLLSPRQFYDFKFIRKKRKAAICFSTRIYKTVERSHWKKEMACPITCQMWEKSLRRVTWASQLAWALTQHLSHLSA